jgi:hypothetical protein
MTQRFLLLDPVIVVSVVVNIPVGVVIVVTDPINVSHCRPVCVDGQTQYGVLPFITHTPAF